MKSHFLVEARIARPDDASAEAYPFNLPALRKASRIVFHPSVTFLVGENGSGKSTLLEALAVALGFNAEGGTKNFRFDTRPSHSDLHRHLRLVRGVRAPRSGFFLRAESFYNVATEVERLGVGEYYGPRSLHEQSHGESFLTLFLERFRGESLYFLDEPEAALSPARQLAVLTRMHDLAAQGCQFVVATHSPILLAFPDAKILLLDEGGIRDVAYEDTEHYALTRRFLNDHRGMLARLLAPDAG